jgi:hypothetical protein
MPPKTHHDTRLGPRRPGAPCGNLNALKHGRHSRPFPLPDLDRLAGQICDTPHELPAHVSQTVVSIMERTADPYKVLIVLRGLLTQLIPLITQRLLMAQLNTLAQRLPASKRPGFLAEMNRITADFGLEQRILFLRKTQTIQKQLQSPGSEP